jgi:hypothetical protein
MRDIKRSTVDGIQSGPESVTSEVLGDVLSLEAKQSEMGICAAKEGKRLDK